MTKRNMIKDSKCYINFTIIYSINLVINVGQNKIPV
jgi:hypothetical protein